ncbi:DUF6090 family protein [Psychroserpens sp. SPM9]|uniref:DUF6090 family protein n=1 Tax=Psychroserpens sp. SPM9 TaxID=2975598 RepID=UPI0021A83FC2|nr:DUF6090 family protein [Psychroserpens sp. SPM9]MDG5491780.1 DUF6090 family protein [Psychroserpens sp. SPM9]
MENKSTKYFKYAIGEIILVVIGILIALQINNWNENRKTEVFENEILTQIRANLIKDKQVLTKYIHNAKLATVSIDKILAEDLTLKSHDSIKYWLADVVRFDRYRPLTNAYEVLKSQGIDKISNKQLQFLLGMYYDDQSVAANTACHDLEIMFLNDWLPILKKNIVHQEFGVVLELQDYSEIKAGGEIRNLLILNKDNWGGSNSILKEVVTLIDELETLIKKELDD